MYGLDCDYYDKQFETMDELLEDIMTSGMDPDYKITRNGKVTEETAWEILGPTA